MQVGERRAERVESDAGGGHGRERALLIRLEHGATRPACVLGADERLHLGGERAGRDRRQQGPPRVLKRLARASRVAGGAVGGVDVGVGERPAGQRLVGAQTQRPFEEHGHPRLDPVRGGDRAGVHAIPQRRGPQQVLARLGGDRARPGSRAGRGVGHQGAHGGELRHVVAQRMLGGHPGGDGVGGQPGLRGGVGGRLAHVGVVVDHEFLQQGVAFRGKRAVAERATRSAPSSSPASRVTSSPLTRQASVPSADSLPS